MKFGLSLVLIACVACSPVKPSGEDTDANNNNIDGGADQADAATSADAAPALASVRVLDDELNPVLGAKVLFSNPDGSQISLKVTNATGDASEIVPEGAVVTVGMSEMEQPPAFRGGTPLRVQHHIYQIHGVQPGDQIEIGPVNGDPDYADLGTATIAFQSNYAGADHYRVGSDCSTYTHTASPDNLQMQITFRNDRCHGTDARRDLLAYAYADNTSDLLVAWTTFDDVTFGGGVVTSSNAWSNSFSALQLNATNIPFDGSLGIEAAQFKRGVDYSIGSSGDGGAVTSGGSLASTASLPTGFADALQVRAQGFGQNGSNGLVAFVIESIATSATSHTIDYATLGYPSFTDVSMNLTMPLRPSIVWTETGSAPSSAEARIFFVSWDDNIANIEWEFQAMAPLGVSSPLVSPTLPADFITDPVSGNNAWPPPPAAPLETAAAGMMELGDLDGWDEVRQQRGLAVFGDSDDFQSPDAPVGQRTVLFAGGQLNIN